MNKNLLEIGKNIIEVISNKLIADFNGFNFSEALLIFPHKRPKFFIEKILSEKLRRPFYPPVYFDMDLFIQNLLGIDSFTEELDLYFIIFNIFEKHKKFKYFYNEKPIFALEWAKSFLDAFDKVQMELIDLKILKNIESEEEKTFYEYFPIIYKEFLDKLNLKKMITRGMAYNLSAKTGNYQKLSKFKKIYFVVPSGLTKSEKEILHNMKELDNLEIFLEGFDLDENLNILRKKNEIMTDFHVFACSSDHYQLVQLQENLANLEKEENVAIVLPKSKNLLPLLEIVLNSFPDKEFNISLGYPIYYSPVFKFIETIFNLQIHKLDGKYASDSIIKFLSNPFVFNLFSDKKTKLKKEIRILKKNLIDNNIYYLSKEEIVQKIESISKSLVIKEFVKKVITDFILPFESIINLKDLGEKVYNVLNILSENKILKFNPLFEENLETIYKFLFQLEKSEISKVSFEKKEDHFKFFLFLLKNQKINFKGHPLKGWQVLGFLETRTLAFENVFILNLNEGVLPAIDIYDPVIPLNIKKELGLPGPEEEEEIYKHHFLHLLNSSKKCFLYYLENEGEETKSRFLEQIIWEKEKKEKKLFNSVLEKEFNLAILKKKEFKVEKNEGILKILKEKTYSPSSIDNYLKCPLKFYFENFLELKEKEELEEEPEEIRIGNIIHEIIYNLLIGYKGKNIKESDLKEIGNKVAITLEEVFQKKGIRNTTLNKILKELIIFRISNFLKLEISFPIPFQILDLEEEIKDIPFNGVKLKGRMDRIDKLSDDKIRVVDYKSGKLYRFFKSKKNLNLPTNFEEFQKEIESFQVPIYLYLLKETKNINYEKLSAFFYSFKEGDYYPKNDMELENIIINGENLLKNFIDIILDKNLPFEAKPKDTRNCQYCNIINFCER